MIGLERVCHPHPGGARVFAICLSREGPVINSFGEKLPACFQPVACPTRTSYDFASCHCGTVVLATSTLVIIEKIFLCSQ